MLGNHIFVQEIVEYKGNNIYRWGLGALSMTTIFITVKIFSIINPLIYFTVFTICMFAGSLIFYMANSPIDSDGFLKEEASVLYNIFLIFVALIAHYVLMRL